MQDIIFHEIPQKGHKTLYIQPILTFHHEIFQITKRQDFSTFNVTMSAWRPQNQQATAMLEHANP